MVRCVIPGSRGGWVIHKDGGAGKASRGDTKHGTSPTFGISISQPGDERPFLWMLQRAHRGSAHTAGSQGSGGIQGSGGSRRRPGCFPAPRSSPPPQHVSYLESSRNRVTCLLGGKAVPPPSIGGWDWGPSEPLEGIGLPLFQPPSCTPDWPNRFWGRGAGSRHVETATCLPARFPPPQLPLPTLHNAQELALPSSGAMLTSPPEDLAATPEPPGPPGAVGRVGGWMELPG